MSDLDALRSNSERILYARISELEADHGACVSLDRIKTARIAELEAERDQSLADHDIAEDRITELEAGLRKIGNQYPSARLENAWNRSARRIARRVLEGKA